MQAYALPSAWITMVLTDLSHDLLRCIKEVLRIRYLLDYVYKSYGTLVLCGNMPRQLPVFGLQN